MRVLLMQGAFGLFSHHAIKELKAQGHTVFKISFNGGDYSSGLFYGDKFKQPPHRFRQYFKNYVKQNGIEVVVAFGDCRYYHRIASMLCKKQNIPFVCMEEGYLRPNYLTIDAEGVNANSKTDFFEEVESPKHLSEFDDSHKTKNLLLLKTPHVIVYYLAKFLMRPVFPFYHHHRSYSIISEAFYWVRSAKRRVANIWNEQSDISKIIGSEKFYFIPLQVHNDSQLVNHSAYESIEQFIEYTVESFAKSAPRDTCLVFKHHPQDIGFKNYKKYVRSLTRRFKLKGRVIVINDFSVPNLLRECEGVVTINSTVGISSVIHNKPTICLGRCFYNNEGITYQKGLDNFWSDLTPPDPTTKKLMLHNIRTKTQVNGSFYDYSKENIQACVQVMIHRAQKHWNLKKNTGEIG